MQIENTRKHISVLRFRICNRASTPIRDDADCDWYAAETAVLFTAEEMSCFLDAFADGRIIWSAEPVFVRCGEPTEEGRDCTGDMVYTVLWSPAEDFAEAESRRAASAFYTDAVRRQKLTDVRLSKTQRRTPGGPDSDAGFYGILPGKLPINPSECGQNAVRTDEYRRAGGPYGAAQGFFPSDGYTGRN